MCASRNRFGGVGRGAYLRSLRLDLAYRKLSVKSREKVVEYRNSGMNVPARARDP